MLPVVVIDRALMGFSLAVHIILASIGIALPLIIAGAEFLSIKYGDRYYKTLAKRMTTVLIIFFAVGTASGIAVAIELFVLWPNFISLVGQVAILSPYLENFAFFTEAIFLAIYVYSWNKFKSRYGHLLTLIPVIIGSAATAALITVLNAFMNAPTGFDIGIFLKNGTVANVNPLAVFTGPSVGVEVWHVLSTTYFSGLFIFAAYFAYRLLIAKDEEVKNYYRKALALTMIFVTIATIASIFSGVQSISSLYSRQPEKYAAIEGDLVPTAHAPEYIGGLFINGSYKYYLTIPDLQSILASGNASGVVPGLSLYAQSSWPPLFDIHLMFDIMVLGGFGIGIFIFIVVALLLLKREPYEKKSILYLIILSGILALLLLEIGWVMSETARQPWIVYNVMTVDQAANYSESGFPILIALVLFYVAVIPLSLIVLRRVLGRRPLRDELVA